jgi:hypothetical protein
MYILLTTANGSVSAETSRWQKGDKSKSKVHPRTSHEGPKGEYRYSSTLSLTSAPDEDGWSRPFPEQKVEGNENARHVKRVMAVADNKSIQKFALACSFGTKVRYTCFKWLMFHIR